MAITRSSLRKRGLEAVSQLDDINVELLKNKSGSITAIASLKTVKKQQQLSIKPKLSRQPVSDTRFGLIQELLQDNLYALCVQVILWNQTHGKAARPVLDAVLLRYPDPASLANADLSTLTAMILPIGLHNRRAARLIALAQKWLKAPPCKSRRYRKIGYPNKQSGKDIKPNEVLDESDPREGYEISHLPGIGAYALDSYRIFHRDKLRDIGPDEEPEWKRVVAGDKELRAWLVWRWAKEGYHYDIESGKKTAFPDQRPTSISAEAAKEEAEV